MLMRRKDAEEICLKYIDKRKSKKDVQGEHD